LHTVQLMPLPLTVSCFSKIQIDFAFLVPAHLGSPGQRAVKRVRACVRACNACSSVIELQFHLQLSMMDVVLDYRNCYCYVVGDFHCFSVRMPRFSVMRVAELNRVTNKSQPCAEVTECCISYFDVR